MAVDGDIKLSVSLDSKESKKSANDLGKTIESALSSSSNKVRGLGNQLQKVSDNIRKVDADMAKLRNTKTPTQQFQDLTKELNTTLKGIEKVDAEMKKLRTTGKNQAPTTEYKQLLEDEAWVRNRYNTLMEKKKLKPEEEQEALGLKQELRDIRDEQQALKDTGEAFEKSSVYKTKEEEAKALKAQLDEINKKQAEMQRQGTAFTTGEMSPEYRELTTKKQALEAQAEAIKRQIHGMNDPMAKFASGVTHVSNVFKSLKSVATSVLGGIKRGFKTLTQGVNSHHKSANLSFKKLLTMVLKYGLGIRSIFLLYRRLRAIISQGITELGSQFNEVQQQINGFKNSWSGFKSGLVSAFQPIYSLIIPALTTLIGYLTSAMNALANFFALLTGQGFYYKAIKGNKDYAKSVGGAGGAAEKASEKIAEYDKLIVIDSNDSGGGGGGGGGAGSEYNWEKVNTTANSLVEKLKNMWGVFKQAWEDKGQDVIKAFKYALQAIKDLIVDIGNTFYEVFMEGYGYSWIISVLGILEQMLLLVGDIATSIKEAWDNNENGRKLIIAIFDTATKINNLIVALIKSLRQAWNENKLGVRIVENILQIITNIINTVGNLAERFRQAWEKNEVGKRILQTILSTINYILGVINDITLATSEWAKKLDFYPLLESIQGLLDKTRPIIQDIADTIKVLWISYVLPMGKKLVEEWLPKMIDWLTRLAGDLKPFTEQLAPALEKIAPYVEKIFSVMLAGDLTKLELIVRNFENMKSAVEWLVDGFKQLKGEGKNLVNSLKELDFKQIGKDFGRRIIEGTVYTITTQLKSIISPFNQVAKSSALGFTQGWRDFFNIFSPVQILWDIFKAGFKKIFGISSPAKKLIPYGKNMVLGIVQGIKSAAILVKGAITGIKNIIGDLLKKGLDIAVNFITKLSGVATSLSGIDNLKTKFTNMYNAFKNKTATFTSKLSGAATKIDDLVDIKGKFTELHDKWEGAKATFSTFIGGAIKNINELSTNKDSWLSKFTNLKNKWSGANATFKTTVGGAITNINELSTNKDSWLTKFNNLYKGWKDKNANAKFNASFNKSQDEISGYASAMSTLASSWQSKSATFTMQTTVDYQSINANMEAVKRHVRNIFGNPGAKAIFGIAKGGIITPIGVQRFASGGVVSNGMSRLWGSIPKLASGGSAHGTMFIAGEAGPEVVGHVGNRTEVLNKSQLATTMLAAVKSGMLAAMRSVLPTTISLDYTSFLSTLNSTPIPVIVRGQVLPVNQAFMTKLDDENKTLSSIESMLQLLIDNRGENNHDPIRLELDGRLFAELIWNEQEKKYKQSGRYSPRYV